MTGIRGIEGLRPLVVINSLLQGGAEQSTTDTLLHLHRQGLVPEVVCLRRDDTPLARSLDDAGIPVTYLDPDASSLTTIRRLRHRIKEHRADLVHVTLYESTVLGSLAALGTGVPVLTSVVSTPQHLDPHASGTNSTGQHLPWKRRVVLATESVAYRRADRIHAVTAGVGEVLTEVHGVDPAMITVVERGRDAERFAPVTSQERAETRRSLGLADDDRMVLCVGRHDRDKGFERLVPGFDHLDRPDIHVFVAGRESGATAELTASIAAARRPERFHLLGERTDIPALLGATDVFLLSSRREGAAGAALEAMAVGAPIVTVPLRGLRGVITDGVDGLVVPLIPATALGDATVDLIDDPARSQKMAAEARALFLRRFTLDGAAERMGGLYVEVADQGRHHHRARHRDPVPHDAEGVETR